MSFAKLFPIEKGFSLLSAILFLLCVSHSLLRNLKDALILTSAGAEAIPFLKTWAMLPASCIAVSCYTKLAHRFSTRGAFIPLVSFFISYFLLFSFVLYPARGDFSSFSCHLRFYLPKGLWAITDLLDHWSCVLFYLMAELWSVLIISVAFWSVVNDLTDLSKARRSYAFLNLSSTLAPICSGLVAYPFLSFSNWEISLKALSLLVAVFGFVILFLFSLLEKSFPEKKEVARPKSISLWNSLQTVFRSKPLRSLAVMIVCYNMAGNIADVLWKKQLEIRFPRAGEVFRHTSSVTILAGCIASVSSFLVPLSKASLFTLSLISPVVLLISSVAFCLFSLPQRITSGISSLHTSVLIGSVEHALSKGLKYSLIDICKELVLVSLDSPLRLQGKTIVDGLGGEVGKTLGSLFCQGMLLVYGRFSFVASALSFVFIFACWFASLIL